LTQLNECKICIADLFVITPHPSIAMQMPPSPRGEGYISVRDCLKQSLPSLSFQRKRLHSFTISLRATAKDPFPKGAFTAARFHFVDSALP
jgi:hypothetical protein